MKTPLALVLAVLLCACTTPNERRMVQLDKMHAAGQISSRDLAAEKRRLMAEDDAYRLYRIQMFHEMNMGIVNTPAPQRPVIINVQPGYRYY